jgi:hypothetical protein
MMPLPPPSSLGMLDDVILKGIKSDTAFESKADLVALDSTSPEPNKVTYPRQGVTKQRRSNISIKSIHAVNISISLV